MRIAVVHSFYSSAQPSGENVAVESQIGWLREAGHDVTLIAQRTDDREGRPLHRLRSAANVASGRGPSPIDELTAFEPDVVHVHNTFPNWSTHWIAGWRGPVVATAHNFRSVCASGTLYREGRPCTECIDVTRWAGLSHSCYRGSRLATLPISWRNRRGLQQDPVLAAADAVIVLSESARRTFARAGLPPERMFVIPNAVQDPYGSGIHVRGQAGRWLYAGRLSPEKGLLELLDRWPPDEVLDIVGTGPLAEAIHARTGDNVHYMGHVEHASLLQAMPTYLGLVFPSRWLEHSPITVIEALAAGLPLVALNGNMAADLVAQHHVGAVVNSEDEWASALRTSRSAQEEHAEAARRTYETYFTPAALVDALERCYAEVISS